MADQTGVTSIEYALIASLIGTGLFGLLALFEPRFQALFDILANGLQL